MNTRQQKKHLILLKLLHHLEDFLPPFLLYKKKTLEKKPAVAVSFSPCFNETVVPHEVKNLPKHKQETGGHKPLPI